MEKTKKLFAYVVVFAAIVCLFAGIATQSNLANALNSPQISIDKIYGTDGTELAATKRLRSKAAISLPL